MNTLFTITMIVELIFGIGFLAVPGAMFKTFGITADALAVNLIRTLGSALLTFVVILWYARSSEGTEVKEMVTRSLFVYWSISTIVMISGQLAGLFNPLGWGVVVLHLGFAVAYGMYAFRKL